MTSRLPAVRALVPAMRRLPALIAGGSRPDPLFGRSRAELDFLPAALEIVERPPPPAPRLIVLVIVGLIAATLLWATLGKVDVVATASGRVVAAGGGKLIQPLELGRVASIRVVDGELVRAGAVLVTFDPTNARADRDDAAAQLATVRLEIARLRTVALGEPFRAPPGADPAAVQIARHEAEAVRTAQLAKLDGLAGQVAARTADVAVTHAELDRLQSLAPIAQQRLDIIRKLEAKGYASRLRGLDAESQDRDFATSIAEQSHRLPGATAALATARQARAEAEAQLSHEALDALTVAQAKAASLAQLLDKAQSRLDATILRAPVDGMVQELSVHTIGGVVSPGEPILRLSPTGGALEVEARLENRDVGFLRVGMPADVKIETFAFTRYGTIPAVVAAVSGDAVTPPAAPSAPPMAPTGYDARLRLERLTIIVDGVPRRVTPGMAVTAEIRIGRRRIIDYVLSPIERVTSEAGRER